MARMVPSTDPRGGASCPRAQSRLYAQLRDALDSAHLIVHDARWVGPATPDAPLPDAQVDFLIAHPERGLLLLDVYAGGLAHDPNSGGWRQLDADGGRPLGDPFERLRERREALLRQLSAHPSAMPSQPLVGYAVALPQLLAPRGGFGAHAPASRILDMEATQNIEALGAAIEALFLHWEHHSPARGSASSRWWWQIIEDLFVAPRQVPLSLSHRIAEEQALMASLGPGQVSVLELLGRVRRQTIYGPAGTGKTVLAIHKARMLAESGMRVLLTCYNKALGQHLREAVTDLPTVRAQHFHELCYELADLEKQGLRPPTSRQGRRTFFDQTLPELLLAAIPEISERFDALVIDEGQDFHPGWWPPLYALCRDPDRAICYIFYDDRQRLHDGEWEVPGQDEALVLRTNWRNTQRIVRHLAQAEPKLAGTPCAAGQGVPVRFEPLRPDYAHAMRRVLMSLVGREGLRPEDIVVLTGRQPSRSRALSITQPIAGCVLSAEDKAGAIRVRSVQSFKGLEAPVIILTELDQHPPERARRLYYVGASRATGHLIVMDDARHWSSGRGTT